jgi:hypothetical protein
MQEGRFVQYDRPGDELCATLVVTRQVRIGCEALGSCGH